MTPGDQDALAAITRSDGLTADEGEVGDLLVAATLKFGRLPVQHPDERRDFADAIHKIQGLLTTRIARRHYPIGWPDKGHLVEDREGAR